MGHGFAERASALDGPAERQWTTARVAADCSSAAHAGRQSQLNAQEGDGDRAI